MLLVFARSLEAFGIFSTMNKPHCSRKMPHPNLAVNEDSRGAKLCCQHTRSLPVVIATFLHTDVYDRTTPKINLIVIGKSVFFAVHSHVFGTRLPAD